MGVCYKCLIELQNMEKICLKCREENREIRKEKSKIKYLKNQEKFRIRYLENKDHILQSVKEYRINNPETYKKTKSKWYHANKEHVREYKRNLYKNNIQYKLAHNLRSRLIQALRKSKKSKSTLKLLGCTLDEFKKYLESLWTAGMNWDNYGSEWHIDHIKPCCTFNLNEAEDQSKCFYYTNLRPLWRSENLSRPKRGEDYTP